MHVLLTTMSSVVWLDDDIDDDDDDDDDALNFTSFGVYGYVFYFKRAHSRSLQTSATF